jgi:hypothetical protein
LGSSPVCRWRCFADCRLGFGGDELIVVLTVSQIKFFDIDFFAIL